MIITGVGPTRTVVRSESRASLHHWDRNKNATKLKHIKTKFNREYVGDEAINTFFSIPSFILE